MSVWVWFWASGICFFGWLISFHSSCKKLGFFLKHATKQKKKKLYNLIWSIAVPFLCLSNMNWHIFFQLPKKKMSQQRCLGGWQSPTLLCVKGGLLLNQNTKEQLWQFWVSHGIWQFVSDLICERSFLFHWKKNYYTIRVNIATKPVSLLWNSNSQPRDYRVMRTVIIGLFPWVPPTGTVFDPRCVLHTVLLGAISADDPALYLFSCYIVTWTACKIFVCLIL